MAECGRCRLTSRSSACARTSHRPAGPRHSTACLAGCLLRTRTKKSVATTIQALHVSQVRLVASVCIHLPHVRPVPVIPAQRDVLRRPTYPMPASCQFLERPGNRRARPQRFMHLALTASQAVEKNGIACILAQPTNIAPEIIQKHHITTIDVFSVQRAMQTSSLQRCFPAQCYQGGLNAGVIPSRETRGPDA